MISWRVTIRGSGPEMPEEQTDAFVKTLTAALHTVGVVRFETVRVYEPEQRLTDTDDRTVHGSNGKIVGLRAGTPAP